MKQVSYRFATHSGGKLAVSAFCYLAAALFAPSMMADGNTPNIGYDSPQGSGENCGTVAIENILMQMYNAGLLGPPTPTIPQLKAMVEQACSNECVNAKPPQPPPSPTNSLDDVIIARVLAKLSGKGFSIANPSSYWDWFQTHRPGPKSFMCILVEFSDGTAHWQTVDSSSFDGGGNLTVSDPNSKVLGTMKLLTDTLNKDGTVQYQYPTDNTPTNGKIGSVVFFDANKKTSMNLGGGGKFLAAAGNASLARLALSGTADESVADGPPTLQFSTVGDIAGSLSAFDFLTQTEIVSQSLNFVDGSYAGGDNFAIEGWSVATVSAAITTTNNLYFGVTNSDGVVTIQISDADTGEVLVSGTGEGGRAALQMTISPMLDISSLGGNVEIIYTGTLLSATNVSGPYTPVTGASSPYTVVPSGPAVFFISSYP